MKFSLRRHSIVLAFSFLVAACGASGAASTEEVAGEALTSAPPILPADYRQQTIPVEHPLVLDYPFGGAASNKVSLNVVNYPNMPSDLFFFHMHANETTSKATGENAVRTKGGTFMYMTHSTGLRDVQVKIGSKTYDFDPNRIFTATGLQQTSPTPTGTALAELQKFVDWVKQNISIARGQRARPMVIGLHNNTDDDTQGQLLSILTEQQLLNIDNRAVNQNHAWDIDNFFIATLQPDYDTLVASSNPNISLRMEHPRDIGYLSNWMIDDGVEYLNVETQQGDTAHDQQMVDIVQSTLH